MDLGLCKDQFLMFLCMYYVFCMHEKELVGQKSLFFYKQCVGCSSGFIAARVGGFISTRAHRALSILTVMMNGTFLALVPIVCVILILQVGVLSIWPHKVLFLSLLLVILGNL
eukprot:TRINITY_DN14_c0_g1_i1.p1 TRINITY_DN14_c0_g1~~TRINITY_DN14_c0_g1_i1.p1  ORF type:complete len:113 (+),score=0.19 TRINITY_DN14_c0_g1_i1:1948-2286(+)